MRSQRENGDEAGMKPKAVVTPGDSELTSQLDVYPWLVLRRCP